MRHYGTKAFTLTRSIQVEPLSHHPAVQAVFQEQPGTLNLPTNSTWRCGMAVPILVASSEPGRYSGKDSLLVGALVLNSDRILPIDPDPTETEKFHGKPISLIAAYHAAGSREAKELGKALRDCALELFENGGVRGA